MRTGFATNFVENCHVNAGKDGCLMRQHFHHFKNKKQKGNIGHSMNTIFAFFPFSHIRVFFIHSSECDECLFDLMTDSFKFKLLCIIAVRKVNDSLKMPVNIEQLDSFHEGFFRSRKSYLTSHLR